MKHKTAELEGALLDAAVAKAEGWTVDPRDPDGWWSPDMKIASSITDRGIAAGYGYHPAHFWSDGGPIIERERIDLESEADLGGNEWVATAWPKGGALVAGPNSATAHASGPTPLIAAMRAYVASKFGEEIDLP